MMRRIRYPHLTLTNSNLNRLGSTSFPTTKDIEELDLSWTSNFLTYVRDISSCAATGGSTMPVMGTRTTILKIAEKSWFCEQFLKTDCLDSVLTRT